MNNNIDYPPFYVGEEVVAIRSHSLNVFKKGDEFTIRAVRKGCCEWLIDIGICANISIYGYPVQQCPICNKMEKVASWWMFASSFVSKSQEQFKQVEFNKILENEPCAVN